MQKVVYGRENVYVTGADNYVGNDFPLKSGWMDKTWYLDKYVKNPTQLLGGNIWFKTSKKGIEIIPPKTGWQWYQENCRYHSG